MLVSHIKNLWTLPPPTTWPQEAPPIGWLCRQPIPMLRFSEGGRPFPTANIILFSNGCPKGFVFLVLYQRFALATARLRNGPGKISQRGAHLAALSGAYCVMPFWWAVQTCLFCRLIRVTDFASKDLCGSLLSEFNGPVVCHGTSLAAPRVHVRAFLREWDSWFLGLFLT